MAQIAGDAVAKGGLRGGQAGSVEFDARAR
jgi:hypothetical protein